MPKDLPPKMQTANKWHLPYNNKSPTWGIFCYNKFMRIFILILVLIVAALMQIRGYTITNSPLIEYINQNSPVIIAHRGAADVAPENTLAAFRRAVELGADGIELDVHLTLDGYLVVIHDYTINRTARMPNDDVLPAEINIADSTLYELRQFDFGIWFAPEFAGERIPILTEVLDAVPINTIVNIEIKAYKGQPFRAPAIALAQYLAGRENTDYIFVSSFNPMALNAFRRGARRTGAQIPTALIYGSNKEVPWYLHHGRGRILHNADILKPRAQDVRTERRPIIAWNVHDTDTVQKVMAAGAIGIITSNIGLINRN